MALKDNSTLKPNTGRFYTAPVGTPLPADLRNPGEAWEDIGHTSLEDIVAISSEGGETSTLGSLQNKTLRNSTTPRVESFGLNLHQFDETALQLYYGSNAKVSGNYVEVPDEPVATERAWLGVLYDGNNDAGFYAAKASIFRSDDVAISDTESLAQLPLSVTPLKMEGANSPYTFIMPHKSADVTP